MRQSIAPCLPTPSERCLWKDHIVEYQLSSVEWPIVPEHLVEEVVVYEIVWPIASSSNMTGISSQLFFARSASRRFESPKVRTKPAFSLLW